MKFSEMRTFYLYVDVHKNVHSFCYPTSFEKLVGNYISYYSRKINRQHRIVYSVIEEKNEIHIIRMWTHYDK